MPLTGVCPRACRPQAYCAHALSHVLRTRARIVHHNSKVSKKEEVPDSYRDQGLTRPKVLIVAPFKHSAFRSAVRGGG